VLAMSRRHAALVTMEDNAAEGGAGSAVLECLQQHEVLVPVLTLGIPDRFIEHGSRQDNLVAAGLDDAGLRAALDRFLKPLRTPKAAPAAGA